MVTYHLSVKRGLFIVEYMTHMLCIFMLIMLIFKGLRKGFIYCFSIVI